MYLVQMYLNYNVYFMYLVQMYTSITMSTSCSWYNVHLNYNVYFMYLVQMYLNYNAYFDSLPV
jgi:hypothetical protein